MSRLNVVIFDRVDGEGFSPPNPASKNPLVNRHTFDDNPNLDRVFLHLICAISHSFPHLWGISSILRRFQNWVFIKSPIPQNREQGKIRTGHAAAAFTLDKYGHFTEQMARDSAARMERFIEEVLNL